MGALSSGNITPTALLGRRFFIVADLTIGGAQVLVATAELAIPWANADRTLVAAHYLSRPVEVTIDAGWGKPENTPPSAVIEIPLTGRIADLRRAGSLGSGIRCEVFLWVEGTDYTDREVLVSGSARLVQWGASGEAVVFNITQEAGLETGIPLDIGAIDDSFGLISIIDPVEENLSTPYPFVFGPAESSSAVFAYTVRRSEGIAYAQNTATEEVVRVAIAGHRVEATTVVVVADDGTSDTLGIEYRQDDTGRDVASVNLVGSALTVAKGTTYTVKWVGDGGALIDEGRVVVGAGHLILYMLRTSRLPVDFGRLASARTVLDTYNVAGTIQEPVGALQYIGDALASVIPFTLTIGPQGWWAWPWPTAPRRSEAVASLDPANGDVVRDSELILDSGSVVNDIDLSYAVDQSSGNMTRRVRVGGRDTDTPLGACINSQTNYGIRSATPENVAIERQGSATRAIVNRLSALAMPRARVSYTLTTSYAWLRPRHIVTLNDADIDTAGVCVVDAVTISEVEVSATLIILTPYGVE